MVRWTKLFGWDGHARQQLLDETRALLPYSRDDGVASPIPATEVTRVALRLKHQIEQVIPCELEENRITDAHSSIITPAVVATAKSAGKVNAPGDANAVALPDYSACVVYCLLVCKKWFRQQAAIELWDSDLHDVRAVACEVLAKRIIEEENDQATLMHDVLLKRYSIIIDGAESAPANVIERAVDLHAVRVIGSSGYQKCISHLWRGWLVQDDEDPNRFVEYSLKSSTSFWIHFDPDRMRVPRYQNALQVVISVTFLVLYTAAINTINPSGDLDVIEILLYFFTVGYIADELAKLYKVGRHYLGFWNVFNSTLYVLLVVSFITRMIALSYPPNDDVRLKFNRLSYNFLAFSAPMFWGRLLLYLDTFRFFGAMLVVLKVMMKESLIFFALLIVVLIGFAQAFLGMDQADDNYLSEASFIFTAMVNAIMGSPEFDGFDRFAPPFGLILYYIYNFIIVVILLNVLIALYNSAYEDITGNAIDEYMALFAQKTMQFIRAPDENVFIPPFNLIELFALIIPLEWWMPRHYYERLNNVVMGVIYAPMLLCTATIESSAARKIQWNTGRGHEEDDVQQEWEVMDGEIDFEGEGWDKRVQSTKPNVEVDGTLLEVRELRREMKELKEMIGRMSREGTPAMNGDGA